MTHPIGGHEAVSLQVFKPKGVVRHRSCLDVDFLVHGEPVLTVSGVRVHLEPVYRDPALSEFALEGARSYTIELKDLTNWSAVAPNV